MVPNKTLNIAGERSINVRASTGSTMRLTCAVTVSAAGDILRPFIVFKGKCDGRIAREFGNPEKSDFPVDCSYMCQDRAWMDEAVMLQWVKEVLEPWSKHVPPGIVPYLLLDSYKCHLMSSVVRAIQDLEIEVEHIPGGCTGLVQPLDVGVNKPLKNRIRRKWEEYMLEEGLAMTVEATDKATNGYLGYRMFRQPRRTHRKGGMEKEWLLIFPPRRSTSTSTVAH